MRSGEKFRNVRRVCKSLCIWPCLMKLFLHVLFDHIEHHVLCFLLMTSMVIITSYVRHMLMMWPLLFCFVLFCFVAFSSYGLLSELWPSIRLFHIAVHHIATSSWSFCSTHYDNSETWWWCAWHVLNQHFDNIFVVVQLPLHCTFNKTLKEAELESAFEWMDTNDQKQRRMGEECWKFLI